MLLRDLKISDESLVFKWIKNDELRKMIGTRGKPTIDSHKVWFKNKLEMKNNIIRVIEIDSLSIGLIGTNYLDLNNFNAEIYLYIGEIDAKGNGYGTEAVNLFVNYLFENYNLRKVIVRIFSVNYPSIKLFEKCGFIFEGCQKSQVMFDGKKGEFCDLLWYAIFNERWKL